MNRAYSTLELKAVDGPTQKRTFSGIASTPSTDRMGDVVEPSGASFKLPIPLLWQHDSRQPIGWVTAAKVTDKGIEVEGEVAEVAEDGKLKDRLDEAWQSIKAKLVRGLSIGFNSIESARIDGTYGIKFIKWEWLELSAVTIPANSDASIQTIKSIDNQILAASGHREKAAVRVEKTPGVPGKPTNPATMKGKAVKTIAEQIASFEAKRAASAARMQEIMQKSAEEGRTLEPAETEEYDGLQDEVKAVDSHLVRLRDMEKTNLVKATPVVGTSTEAGTQARAGVTVNVKTNLPKGTAFSRYAIALARSKGNLMQAAEIAKGWQDTPEVETVLKAAVAAGTTTDASWAAPLVPYQDMASEFIELLRPQTIIGKIEGLRRVPFNIRMPGQTTGSSVGWVGEGAPKPVSALAFDTTTLRFTKVAGIVVLTEELVRFSNPSAEAIVSQDLRDSIAQFLDQQFITPSVAEVANVSPASITNGVTAIAASGTDAEAVRADVRALFAAFIAANLTPASGVFVMSPTTALALSMMVNPLGQPEFAGISMSGGTFFGLPVVVSQTAGNIIALVNASDILVADDGGVTLDVSREASLQMNSTPDNPVTATTTMVSLWQNNMVGLRAERFINWKRRRAAAVQYISGVAYGTVTAG